MWYFYFLIQSQSIHSKNEQMMFLSLLLITITNLLMKRARLKTLSIFSLIIKLICIYYLQIREYSKFKKEKVPEGREEKGKGR